MLGKSKLSEQKEIIDEFMKAKFSSYKENLPPGRRVGDKPRIVSFTRGFHQGNKPSGLTPAGSTGRSPTDWKSATLICEILWLTSLQELVEDMLAIVTCFSAKLYGQSGESGCRKPASGVGELTTAFRSQQFKKKVEQALRAMRSTTPSTKEVENGGSDKNHQNQDSKS